MSLSIEEKIAGMFIPAQTAVDGFGELAITVDNGAVKAGKLRFLAIYEDCASYEPIGNGLLGLRQVEHSRSVLTTAELDEETAYFLAKTTGDDKAALWIMSEEEVGRCYPGTNCIYMRTEKGVRLFFAAVGQKGAVEVYLHTETDLRMDFSSEMLPAADLDYLVTCDACSFRRTHPNWTFVRLK